MGVAQQVQHHLHGVEGFDRDLHEEGVPVGHGAVPQAREFERLELASLVALGADQAGLLVHVVQQVELGAVVAAQDRVNAAEDELAAAQAEQSAAQEAIAAEIDAMVEVKTSR